MDQVAQYIWIIPAAPLAGFIINGLISFSWGAKSSDFHKKVSTIVSPLVILISFLVTLAVFIQMVQNPETNRIFSQNLYSWIKTGFIEANVNLVLDPLSIILVLIITGVGFFIHLYSVGYMDHDRSIIRYFAYLNLFTFAMLILVLGDNILLMFVGWEGVGLCSYLLIGFWYQNRNYAIAGMKAFLVNRVGDFAFIIGFFMLFWGIYHYEGVPTIAFSALKDVMGKMPEWYLTIVTLMFFIGATGKSAQIPLYIWLPDAMAGPTPVSALIHAATMVTAGVYMIARMSFLFIATPMTLTVISIIAAGTAFFAATIGIVQNDIKKVLAYSTVSQLGYMFLGMGTGVFTTGIFHLMTHAFFKGLLFLGAGSVILASHHEQDILLMGGLRKKIPITFITFLIGTLAIAGIPGLSGFFSKDEILWQTYITPNVYIPQLPHILWIIGLATAGITSFYMFRLLFLTFFGEFRGDEGALEEVHESPFIMTIPLMVLAVLSIFGGYIGMPEALGGSNHLHHWLSPVLSMKEAVEEHGAGHFQEYLFMGFSILVSLSGAALAYIFYILKPSIPKSIGSKISGLHQLVFNKYYIDELYHATFIKGTLGLRMLLNKFDQKIIDAFVNFVAVIVKAVSRVHGFFDRVVVDGLVNFVAAFTQYYSSVMQTWQSGMLNRYLYYILGSFIMAYVILRII
ncbi:MAG: NADH-quinone oxidoreductase subunit L [Spirochaetia bacterium]|nr:NADH-quinone oxidoreductase subunit L [Spirochaetia bacterium]